MTLIRSLFSTSRPIDRRIEKVIDYAALSDDRVLAEIDEYEATDNVENCFRKFLENYRAGVEGGQVAEVGVWVSGFYGSGKSSFTKYLGLALEGKEVGGRPFVDLLAERIRASDVAALLRAVSKRAPTGVVFLDLGSEQLAGDVSATVSSVLYWKVLHLAGYSKEKKLAQLELTLEQKGKYDEFKRRHEEQFGEPWESIHHDPVLGNAQAAEILPLVLPDQFPNPERFSEMRFEMAESVSDLAKGMVELIRRKVGKQNILFLIDEAGQYVAPRGELILNLDGLVRSFKELGLGKVWVIATAQQTLAEIVTRAQYNSGELNRLQARFPISIELDARDIKEITYRRLLTKTTDGEAHLRKMFKDSGQALVNHTKLEGTTLYRVPPDSDTFVQFYPFLPQHFDLLMELIRTLARSTGGIGLRSAIKVIQDVLVDVSRVLPAGATRLADRPVGALARVDDFFDTLRNDINKVLPHVVTAVDRTARIFPSDSLALRVAKAVAALQPIEGFPASADNLAALLYPAVDAPSLADDVRDALRKLLAEKEIGLIEDPRAEGYVFLSDKVQPLQRKRSEMEVTSGDTNRIRNEILRSIFDPQPSAQLQNTKQVRAAVRSGRLLVAGDSEEITFRLDWVDSGRWDTRRAELLTETTQPDMQNVIAWLARADDTVEELLPEIYKSEQIAGQIDEHAADKDEAQYLRAERKSAEVNREEVAKRLRQALLGGTLIFRGRPTPAAEVGETVDAAATAVLVRAAQDVYPFYRLAPVRAATDLAAKFLKLERLDRAGETDLLKLVVQQGGAPRINISHPALAEVLRAFRAKVEESGGGRLQGNFVQDHFSGLQYGWTKDTVRYLFAALLWAGEIELHTAEGTLRVPGPKAAEACKNTVAFNQVGISLRDTRPDLDALDRAARRLEELFGDQVMPMEESVSRTVRQRVPEERDHLRVLPDRLRLLGLPGEDRVRSLVSTLSQALNADAAGAVGVLGAKQSTMVEDLRWARAVRKAFEDGAEAEVQAAKGLQAALADLDQLFPGQAQMLATPTQAESLAEMIGSERFFERLADVRGLLRAVAERTQARYAEVRQILEDGLRSIRTSLENHPDWPLLVDEDRTAIMSRLETAVPPSPSQATPADLKTLLVRETGLAGLQRGLADEIVRRKPETTLVDETAEEAEVEHVTWADLQPPAVLATERDLETWLDSLRQRLGRLLRARKQIRIE